MIASNHFLMIKDYLDATVCFNNVEIKGGVNYFLYSDSYTGKCKYTLRQNDIEFSRKEYLDTHGLGVVLRDNKAEDIVKKIIAVEGNYFCITNFASIVSPKHYFDRNEVLSSNWKGYVKHQDDTYCIKYYLNKSLEAIGYGWVSKKQVSKGHSTIPLHKVYIPKAGGSGTDPYVLGKPFYGEPNSVCSYTYLVIGYDATKHNYSEQECKNIVSYIKTRFFRYLVSIKKKTQDNPRDVFQFVPLQDFSHTWSDEALYKKYNLTKDEIDYIETLIKPME